MRHPHPSIQDTDALAGHIEALREVFGSDLEVESVDGETPPAAELHRPAAAPPAAGAYDQRGQIGFEARHICGAIHPVIGWPTAAPGLVVFRNGPPNTACGHYPPDEEWAIWQLPGYEYGPGRISASGPIMVGFEDPESAVYEAERIGQFRAGKLTLADLGFEIVKADDSWEEPPPGWMGLDVDSGPNWPGSPEYNQSIEGPDVDDW